MKNNTLPEWSKTVSSYFHKKIGHFERLAVYNKLITGKTDNMNRIIVLFLLLVILSGCVHTVPAWKRGTLARENMALETDALEAGLRQHTFFSKEASSGGYGGTGGGCGCN